MRQLFAVLERVAPSDATLLIEGETGTGKGLAAEAVHAHSLRPEGPFVSLDCSAVSPSLIESELFGHVRGAFTDAVADRLGVFEQAHGGTLFLDEVGELPLRTQPKLLRALERREISRVGESTLRRVDVRVIAATNRNLSSEVDSGRFREDLFFRLAVVEVRLPPLRSRSHDIPRLVRHFVDGIAPGAALPSGAELVELAGRSWPGNVRELRNEIERRVLMHRPPARSSDLSGPGELGAFVEDLLDLPLREAQERMTERFIRAYLAHALQCSGGSVSGAARLMGTNRRYVQRLMRRYGVRADAVLGEVSSGATAEAERRPSARASGERGE